jgi:dTMP kinase
MGAIISFEGGDGSGKGTQSRLLFDYLIDNGVPTKFESFPRYDSPTGKKIAAYLNGELGSNVDPRVASELYSDDRLAYKDEIYDWFSEGGSWVFDRYADSNKGHQGGKIPTEEGRLRYFEESDRIEFIENGMPVPDKTVLFKLPPELAQSYIDQKMARRYTDSKRDIHEADPTHLLNANAAFDLFAKTYPERVISVDPLDIAKRAMRPVEVIQVDIRHRLEPLLRDTLGITRPI